MGLADLPTLAEMNAIRRAQPKGVPAVVERAEKRKTKAQQEKEFRDAVWARDHSRSRASGKPLSRSGTDPRRVGEVHHVLKRSTHPEKRLDPSNGILLSREEHMLAEATCPNDPQHAFLEIVGPEDLSQPQLFVWRDVQGKVIREKKG